MRAHIPLVKSFRAMADVPPLTRTIKTDGVISTKSNLKATVLRDIIEATGLDYSPFVLKEPTVIDRLVRMRNSIAHGHGNLIIASDFALLHRETIAMLDEVRDQIEEAAATQKYLK